MYTTPPLPHSSTTPPLTSPWFLPSMHGHTGIFVGWNGMGWDGIGISWCILLAKFSSWHCCCFFFELICARSLQLVRSSLAMSWFIWSWVRPLLAVTQDSIESFGGCLAACLPAHHRHRAPSSSLWLLPLPMPLLLNSTLLPLLLS